MGKLIDEFRSTQKELNSLLSDLFDTINSIGDTLAIIKDRLFQFDKDITREIEHIYQKLEGDIPIEVYRFILQEYAFVISFRLIEAFIIRVYIPLGNKWSSGLLKSLFKTYKRDIEYILSDSLSDISIRYFRSNQSAFTELQISKRFEITKKYILENINSEKYLDIKDKQSILSDILNILKFATQQFGGVTID